MAMKLSVAKDLNDKTILSRLPRFSLDIRINGRKIVFQYVPITETLFRALKEKKGLIQISKKQFSIFEKKKKIL